MLSTLPFSSSLKLIFPLHEFISLETYFSIEVLGIQPATPCDLGYFSDPARLLAVVNGVSIEPSGQKNQLLPCSRFGVKVFAIYAIDCDSKVTNSCTEGGSWVSSVGASVLLYFLPDIGLRVKIIPLP